jgi:oxidase EvaA
MPSPLTARASFDSSWNVAGKPNTAISERILLELLKSKPLTHKHEVASWLGQVRASNWLAVEDSSLSQSEAWSYENGRIRHSAGRFFDIVGLHWRTGTDAHWRPFIRQREVGTLGFIARTGADGTELLVQAKFEPGNVNIVQLAPTCQATASNSDRVHGGTAAPYAWYFRRLSGEILSNSLQSEQGSRFLGKANRNILVLDQDAEAQNDLHRWVSFKLFRELMADDYMVNTDARSVICATDWRRLSGETVFHADDDLSDGLCASLRTAPDSTTLGRVRAVLSEMRREAPAVELCDVAQMPDWQFDPAARFTVTDGRSSIRHVRVRTDVREVDAWDQPLLENHGETVIDLDYTCAGGILRFGFRPTWEAGLQAGAELAPTWVGPSESARTGDEVTVQVRQSDEGGRFFRDVVQYRLRDSDEMKSDPGTVWLTLSEIALLLPRGFFNNEARSAISLILSRGQRS